MRTKPPLFIVRTALSAALLFLLALAAGGCVKDQTVLAQANTVFLYRSFLDHWALVRWLHARVLQERKISPGDLELMLLTDDPAEAAKAVIDAYEARLAVPGK